MALTSEPTSVMKDKEETRDELDGYPVILVVDDEQMNIEVMRAMI